MSKASSNVKTFTDDNFNVEALGDGAGLVLVDFTATWCGPCKVLAPILSKIAGEYADRLTVGKVDIDDSPGATKKLGVSSVPSLFLFKNGRMVWNTIGVSPKAVIVEAIERNL